MSDLEYNTPITQRAVFRWVKKPRRGFWRRVLDWFVREFWGEWWVCGCCRSRLLFGRSTDDGGCPEGCYVDGEMCGKHRR